MKYKELERDLDLLKSSFERYQKEVRNYSCDKYGLEFNKDICYSIVKMVIHLDCWTGYYGSYGNIDRSKSLRVGDSFERYFINYLNRNVRDILDTIIIDMEKDLKAAIDSEIEAAEKRLAELMKVKEGQCITK